MAGMKDVAFGDQLWSKPTYPSTPGFKKPGTSSAAAKAVGGEKLSARKKAILFAFQQAGENGMTADEAATATGQNLLYVRPRVTELGVAKLLIDTGRTRKNASGLNATVWRAQCPADKSV